MSRKQTQKGSPESQAYITVQGVTRRWDACSTETVRRAARREGWPVYRMGGRVARYRLADVIAYEERCANSGLSYTITPPTRRATGGNLPPAA
jgi:hypothetical protein